MTGLTLPFFREANDFATGDDWALLDAKLKTTLGTRCADSETPGEIPWNQRLGSRLPKLRYRNVSDPTTQELAVHYVVDSIRRNVPDVSISGVSLTLDSGNNKIVLRVR